jgi:hypothetical protein
VRVLVSRAWLPTIICGLAVYGAFSDDTFWSALCIGVLGAVAFVAWVSLNLLADSGTVLWKNLATEATRGLVVTTAYTEAVNDLAYTAIDLVELEDPEQARDLRQRLADANARWSEHV